jgi:predicted acetyltransferase
MSIDVRPIRPDEELISWLDAQTTAFLERGVDLAKVAEEVRQHWDFSRIWGAVDDDRVVGTLRSYATELTVPGNQGVKASAVTQVAVRPTHRRRGLLRRMIEAEHDAARERGETVSMLFASESGIYGRFGYGVATQVAAWTIDAIETGFHDAAGGRTGSVELLDIGEAALDQARQIYEAARRVQPGEIWRRPITWQSDFGLAGRAWGETWKGFLAVHRAADGTLDGYARYRAEAKWDEHHRLQGTATVDDLHALNDEAEVALLRFLVDLDLVRTVRLEARTPTDRLPWLLTNPRVAHVVDVGEGLWMRLHDLPAALGARAYETAGSVVLEVVGGGSDRPTRVALDASPEGARAVATDRSPDLTIDAAALGATYLGGSRLRNAVLARGADEHRAGALADADALLAWRDAPWCSTFF